MFNNSNSSDAFHLFYSTLGNLLEPIHVASLKSASAMKVITPGHCLLALKDQSHQRATRWAVSTLSPAVTLTNRYLLLCLHVVCFQRTSSPLTTEKDRQQCGLCAKVTILQLNLSSSSWMYSVLMVNFLFCSWRAALCSEMLNISSPWVSKQSLQGYTLLHHLLCVSY